MASTNLTPHSTLRPANMIEWLGLITSTIADIKGISWFNSNNLTIKGLCDAINNDANFSTTINAAISSKLESSIYTPTDILNKLKTIDGLNSGLDADTIRGYVPLNKAGDTLTGFLTLNSDPTNQLHAVTKRYVDNLIQGLDIKQSVKAATTTNITLSGAPQTIDGVTMNIGERILVKNQTDTTQNGIYIVQSSSWLRSSDSSDGSTITPGMFLFIEQGTSNADSGWVMTGDTSITIGSSAITFTQFSGAGQIIAGTGLSKNGNTLSITNTGVTAGTYTKVTVNAQGQVISAFSPTTLSGYGITDAINVSNATTTATANKLLYLDSNAKLPASITGNADGNAATATKLTTARTISISGDGTSSGTFDGSSNLTLVLTLANSGVSAGTYTKVTVDSKGRVTTGDTISASDIPSLDWSKITTGKPTTLNGYGITDGVNTSDVVTVATVNKILKLDSNAKLPASITGNADGNAATATKLTTARTISISGDGTSSGTFDGSSNLSLSLTLSNSGVTAGTYTKVTVDSKGRVTTATTLSSSDIPSLDWSKITTGKPTTLSGYGITDSINISNAVSIATANKLLYLDTNGLLPASITGDADSVDGFQGSVIVADKGSDISDWNTLTIPGIYRINHTDWSSNTNVPSAAYSYGTLLVLSSGQSVTQMFITHTSTTISPTTNGSGIWVRSKLNASDWNNWYRLMGSLYSGSGSGFDADTVDGKDVDDSKTDITSLWTASKITAQLALKINNTSAVTTATANKLLYLDSNAKLPTSITGNADGNAATATKLATARTISISGDGTGSLGFDGSSNISIPLTLANSGVTSGTYTKVTVDSKGRVTTATSQSASDIPVLDWSKITTGKPTTLNGYGITDGVNKTGDTLTGFLTLSADPTLPMHAATKQYVDSVAQGLDVKLSVKAATTTNITLSSLPQILDGININDGDRILVKDQTDTTQNGIYIAHSSAWVRSNDFKNGSTISGGSFTFIEQGTNYAETGWVVTTDSPITVGNTPITFTQFTGTGEIIPGTGLSKTGNSIFISSTGVTAGNYTKITVNAQGQVTNGTVLTSSDIPALDWSKIATGRPNTLAGYGIIDAIQSMNAVSSATANKLLYLDSNAKLPASITGNADGNAATASKLVTARNINITSGATGTIVFDGSSDVTVSLTVLDDNHEHTRLKKIDNKTIKPTNTSKGFLQAYFTSLTGLNSVSAGTDYQDLLLLNLCPDTSGGKINALAFDKSTKRIKHFQALQTDSLWGTGTDIAYLTDNVASATKLQSSRNISLTGDGSASGSFDGSSDLSLLLTLSNTGVTAGTYTKVTVDSKGRVTTATSQSASDIPALDWSKITTGKPTTLSGYGVTDGVNISDVVISPSANKLLRLDANGKLPASITGDANTVDGLEGNQFLRSDIDTSTSKNLNVGSLSIGNKIQLLFNTSQNSLDIVFI